MPIPYTYDGPRTSITVERAFPGVAPERLFDAWVTPEQAAQFLFTTKTSKTRYELDVREGGRYKITRQSSGKVYVAEGEYREIARPQRLIFTFGMPQFAADFDTVTVEITSDGAGGSHLKLTEEEMRPGYEKGTISGWKKMLELLAKALAG